jgi:hypothetical protein
MEKAKLEAELALMRVALKKQLDILLEKTREQALKDEALLKKHGHLYKGWQESKSTAQGAAHGLWIAAKGTVTGLWHMGEATVKEAVELIKDPKEEVSRIKKRVASASKVIRLITLDRETHKILMDFSHEYYRVASPMQISYISGELIGFTIPAVTLGLVTRTLSGAAVAAGVADDLLEVRIAVENIASLNAKMSKVTHAAEVVIEEVEIMELEIEENIEEGDEQGEEEKD